MKFNVGDIIYDGGGNGVFCTFVKCKIRQVITNQNYYVVEVLEDYGSIWDKPNDKTAVVGSLQNCLERSAYETYAEAKANLYKDMNFKKNRDYIRAYFNR